MTQDVEKLKEKIMAMNMGKLERDRSAKVPSEIGNWPLQLDLCPEEATFYQGRDLLIASDCTAFAYGNFHEEFMKGKVTLIGCQKLKEERYTPKMMTLFKNNDFRTITLVRMENPCCGQLEESFRAAVEASGTKAPITVKKVTVDGLILEG